MLQPVTYAPWTRNSSSPLHETIPQMIDVGDSKVAYRATGKGPDILFIHGWPVTGATFRNLVPLLESDFRCHVIDLPGTGDSAFDRESAIDLESHTASVLQVISAIGLEDFSIVAHDSGGVIARYVADRAAGVRSLVMSGTEIPGHTPLLITALIATSKLPGADRTLRSALALKSFRRSAMGFGGCFKDKRAIEGDFLSTAIQPIVDSELLGYGAMELLRTLDTKLVDALADVHPKLPLPVQLIWGSRDPFFPVDQAREMASQFPNGDIHIIEGGKLFVHEEFPKEFVRVARKVL